MAGNTGDNVEVIEVIEEVMDNGMAVALIVGGVILGGVLLYGYQEWRRMQAQQGTAPRLSFVPDPADDRPEVVEATPDWS